MRQGSRKPSAGLKKRKLINGITATILSLSSDKGGQLGSAKIVDRIMGDIFNQKNFVKRLCAIRSDADIYDVFGRIDVVDFFNFISDESIRFSLFELVKVQRSIRELRSKLKRRIKKGRKNNKSLKKELKKMEDIYDDGIKTLRKFLGIKKKNKKTKIKDMYPALTRLIDSQKNSYYYSSFADDYDGFDDDDDFEDLDEDDLEIIERARPSRPGKSFANRKPLSRKAIDDFDDEDDDFEDDIDEDDDEDDDDIAEIKEQNARILSSMGALLNRLNSAPTSAPLDEVILKAAPVVTKADETPTPTSNSKLEEVVENLAKTVIAMNENQNKIMDTIDDVYDRLEELEESEDDGSEEVDLMSTMVSRISDNEDTVEAVEPEVRDTISIEEEIESTADIKNSKGVKMQGVEDEELLNPEDLSRSELVEKVNETSSKPKTAKPKTAAAAKKKPTR